MVEKVTMAYTRNKRRRNKKVALGMGYGERSFISRFFFPDSMVSADSTNDLHGVRQSAYRFSLVATIISRVYWLYRLIRGS